MEQAIVKRVARERYETNRRAGVHNAKIGGQSNEETDVNGFGAEVAFCKLLNIYPDFSIEPRRGGADCLVCETEIDVKQTKYETGKLLATLKKRVDDADVYVLMIGVLPSYRFAGWVEAEKLLRPQNITDLGRGKGYALEQGQLNPCIIELKKGVTHEK